MVKLKDLMKLKDFEMVKLMDSAMEMRKEKRKVRGWPRVIDLDFLTERLTVKLKGVVPRLPSLSVGPAAIVTVGGGPATFAQYVLHLLEFEPVLPSSVPVRVLPYS